MPLSPPLLALHSHFPTQSQPVEAASSKGACALGEQECRVDLTLALEVVKRIDALFYIERASMADPPSNALPFAKR